MAASSPALSNNSNEIPSSPFASPSTVTTTMTPPPVMSNSKSLRGLNKPKCIKCGNVARSRCLYQSCKSCCAKAQNPCHIHVLKGGTNIPETLPSTSFPKVDQHSTEATHSVNSQRVTSFRQLSNSFSQISNLQTPLRSKKPLTRKDAQLINEWRFMKLKEFRDRNIEAENEAFDRYMRNVSLLEEAFSVNAPVNNENDDRSSAMNPVRSADDSTDVMVTWFKANIRSDPVRKENIRKRMQHVVDQGLQTIGKFESRSSNGNAGYPDETRDRPKRMKSEQTERSSMLDELIDKVNKARNEEDLKACHDLKSQLLNPPETTTNVEPDIVKAYDEKATRNNASPLPVSSCTLTKSFSTTTIHQESLCRIDEWFSTLQDIEEL